MQGSSSFIWLIGFFALMYFLMIRPQQKQKKKRQEVLDNIQKGEKVVTIGGIHGKIVSLDKETMMLEIADGVIIKMQRSSVGFVVEESTDEIEEDEADEPAEETEDK